MIFLGIDYGKKRVGLALGQFGFAEPLTIIENTSNLLSQLQQVMTDHQIETIVVGVSDREMAEETIQFAQKLRSLVHKPIYLVDESFSSKETMSKLIEAGAKQKRRGQPIDQLAASQFLQDFMDTDPSLWQELN